MNQLEAREILKASTLFDANWYLDSYPDVAISGLDPVDHFLRVGAKLGRDPSAHFSCRKYLQDSPDVARAGVNPLYHYLKWGQDEGRFVFSALTTTDKTELFAPQQRQNFFLSDSKSDDGKNSSYDVKTLVAQLWGGYARHTLPVLEQIKLSQDVDGAKRASAALALMQWYYVQGDFSQAYENIELYNFVYPKKIAKRYVLSASRCLMKLGRYEDAFSILERAIAQKPAETDYWFLKGAIERELGGEANGEERQMANLRHAYELMGLAPITKKDPSKPLSFSNIVAHPKASSKRQSLKVSIIIPAYCAESSIGYAVESLQLQTWRNLEIIVVDDYSSDNTCEIVSAMMSRDPRIKLIKKTVNEGAYPARNTGLQHVTGDLIMIHDSDDWSHPEKIERQIQTLQEANSAVAVMSMWLRIDDNFVPSVHSLPRQSLKSLSFPSLLFKREVIDEIGPWPAVRVGGDSEFKFRIETVYGAESIVKADPELVLSLSLLREDSLTQQSATHVNSLYFGLRWHYTHYYQYLHKIGKHTQIEEYQNIGNTVVVANHSKRITEHKLDFVFVSDFVTEIDLLTAIEAAAAQGATVGVYHWRKYGEDVTTALSDELYSLCLRHSVIVLMPSDTIQADAVIFGDLSIAERLQDRFPCISSNSLIVLLDDSSEKNGTNTTTDVAVAQANLTVLFGTPGVFVARTKAVKKNLMRDKRYPSMHASIWAHAIAGKKASKKAAVPIYLRTLGAR